MVLVGMARHVLLDELRLGSGCLATTGRRRIDFCNSLAGGLAVEHGNGRPLLSP